MITKIIAKSILRKHKKIDSWFLSHYGFNLYRGCNHNCAYCDGRAETYRVEGEFGRDITVKTNAIELLDRELNPARKRKPMPKGFVMVGGGVSDSYQPIEQKYKLERQTLELCLKYNHPVHILTKSTLVERDIDILKKINEQSKAIVSFSFSSADDNISKIFEPGVSLPSERLATIRKFKNAGISCGMFLMPVIPFVTDFPDKIEQTLRKGKEVGIDFVIFGTMTLKEGQQKEYFMNVLESKFPDLVTEYEIIYGNNNKWGNSHLDYYNSVHQIFDKISSSLKIPKRIPPYIYKNFISKSDLIIVILEHLDYLLKIKNQKNPYGYAAYSLSQLKTPIDKLSKSELQSVSGVGQVTIKLIQEIIQYGRCGYYEKLLY